MKRSKTKIKKYFDYVTLPEPKASKGPLMKQEKPFIHGQDNKRSASHRPTQWSFEEERRGWKNLKEFNEFINEGLIQSASPNKILKHLFAREGFTNDNLWVTDSGVKGMKKIKIDFDSSNIDKVDVIHNKMINLFGWTLSAIETYDMGEPFLDMGEVVDIADDLQGFKDSMKKAYQEFEDEDPLTFVYEPKFDRPFTKAVDKLYHVTSHDNVDKIKEQGLVPKSRMKKAVHPDRIYLVTNPKYFEEERTDLLQHISFPIILEIDVKDLNLNLFYDPNMNGAVYTTDNIPPQNIKQIEL